MGQSVEQLKARLQSLVEERDKSYQRMAELEQVLDDPGDAGDAAETFETLQSAADELNARARVVGPLEQQIERVRAELGEAQTQADQKVVAGLWKEEAKLADRVVKQVDALHEALEELGAVQRRIKDHHGMLKANVPVLALARPIRQVRAHWRMGGVHHDQGGATRRWRSEPGVSAVMDKKIYRARYDAR